MKGLSKFAYEYFYGGDYGFAVSKQRYTLEGALFIFREENDLPKGTPVKVKDAYVVWRAGINEDGERCVGWWLEYTERERSCPVWAITKANPATDAKNQTIYVL